MSQPKASKYTCKICGFTRIYQPKGEVLNPKDISVALCPTCKTTMQASRASTLDVLLHPITSIFTR